MFAASKNSYLQLQSNLDPKIINRCVDRALDNAFDCYDHLVPYLRLRSHQPHIPIENVDSVRRKQAFGRWALPKLYKDLHSKDPIVVLQALTSVSDLLHDPERMFEAVRLKFVQRLAGLLNHSYNAAFQERVLISLQTFGSHAVGREAILSTAGLLERLKQVIDNGSVIIRFKAAAVIELLCRSFTAACALVERDYVPFLLFYVTEDDPQVVMLHLRSLETLFMHTGGQAIGLECDGLNKMMTLLENDNLNVVALAGRCLALLVSLPEGKQLSVDMDILVKLNELLHSQNADVYTSAAQVIMFATHTVQAKHRAAAIRGLGRRLLTLADDVDNPAAQMFSIKALGNICEHPRMRKDFRNKHWDRVTAIRTCAMPELQRYKEILLRVIEWRPWMTG